MNKVFLYLGPFYLSLIFCLLLVYFKKKKITIYLPLAVYLILSFELYFSNIFNLKEDWRKFRLSYKEKIGVISSGQHSFLEDVTNFIPLDKSICYPWPSDIAGRYARQILYPRVVILGPKDIRGCDFLILDYSHKKGYYSQVEQLNNDDEKIYTSEVGEVYIIN